MTIMAIAQLKTHASTSKKSNELKSKQLEMLQELDLRKFMESEPVNMDDNEQAQNEISENISYSLGLLAYAVGLFGIAYWVLVAQHAWLMVGGLASIGLGIKLFLSPINFLKKKASFSSLKDTQIDMDDEFDDFYVGTKF